jgi:sulfatase maturation enzyme AslB (radical SAM superfamily)
MLSQTSLAGEVCRAFVTTDGLKSSLFAGITFSMKPNQIPLNNWMNVAHSFAMQAWGRQMDAAETDAFKSFLQESMTEASRSPNAEKLIGTSSLETINLGIMICTTMLASPEASSM